MHERTFGMFIRQVAYAVLEYIVREQRSKGVVIGQAKCLAETASMQDNFGRRFIYSENYLLTHLGLVGVC